jgi:hypothetical protein
VSGKTEERAVETLNETTPGLEEGINRLVYRGVVEVPGKWGPRNKHTLEAAEMEGERTTFWCDPKMTKGSPQRLLVEALVGREVPDGERIAIRELVGKQVDAELAYNSGGYLEPVKFFRIKQAGRRRLPTPTPTTDAPAGESTDPDAPAGESTDPDEWDAPAS